MHIKDYPKVITLRTWKGGVACNKNVSGYGQSRFSGDRQEWFGHYWVGVPVRHQRRGQEGAGFMQGSQGRPGMQIKSEVIRWQLKA